MDTLTDTIKREWLRKIVADQIIEYREINRIALRENRVRAAHLAMLTTRSYRGLTTLSL